jgi:hypothetical protein
VSGATSALPEDLDPYEAQIPALRDHAYRWASHADPDYNCIAFAAGETSRIWWPPSHIGAITYWPPGVPAWETVTAFVQAFEAIGYERCDSTDLEAGFEKVAIYRYSGTDRPTHAARQLRDGRWASKLGGGIDIEHDDLAAVAGTAALSYGEVAAVLRRSLSDKTA